MKAFILAATIFGSILVGCAHEKSCSQPRAGTTSVKSAEGKWEYRYLNQPSEIRYLEVSPATFQLNGKTFNRIQRDSKDPYARGIRINDTIGAGIVDWAIEGSPSSNPGIYSEESNVILKIKNDVVFLADGEGRQFATLKPLH